LRYLADNPAQTKRLGESGRQLVREEYTVDRMVNRYFDLYEELLTSNLS
jgi:glycosyltransferase involved in cell wall biosynthesis